ncbi:Cell division topological specificity factor homolog, chloroplastic [Linum grandiflorum]
MAISSGNLRVSATLASFHKHPFGRLHSSPTSKVDFSAFPSTGSGTNSLPAIIFANPKLHGPISRSAAASDDYQLSEDTETFLLSTMNMNLFQRLNLAWKIIFPSPARTRSSNARIAKQRLKMILFSDRCAVSDEAKRKIVGNIVDSLSEFVEIESQDKVQLNVSTDTDLGTMYSVTVPVRRVKPEYLDAEEVGSITNIEYKDTGTQSGSVDVMFDFYVPDETTR